MLRILCLTVHLNSDLLEFLELQKGKFFSSMASDRIQQRSCAVQTKTSIDEKDLDPWTAWAYKPRTLTVLLLGACLLV